MGQFIFELILFGIIDPLENFLERKHYSGQWHISHLLPLIIVLFGGMCWLGSRLDSGFLFTLGILGAATAFVIELFVFIPREIAHWQDFKTYCRRRKKEAEDKGTDSGEKE